MQGSCQTPKKIKREIKGLSREYCQESVHYEKSSINFDKLQKVSSALGVDIETIIGYDDKVAFNNFNSKIEQQIGYYNLPIEMKKLYDDKIRLLEEKIEYLQEKLTQRN
ncbi:MAG: hypothetical protein IPJ22_13845 [Bacteroidetes bacterium]|nr:hypothetical protein [Bacteroidota bacterium]